MCILAIITSILLIGIDQWSKIVAVTKLKPIGNIEVIDGFLDFTFVENHGAAFGILSGQRTFFIVISVVAAGVILAAMWKMPHTKEYHWLRMALTLILAGAVGNCIDRIFRGYVVDFFEFTFISYPVFNIADIYVVSGTILLGFLLFFVIKDEKKEE